MFGTKGGSIKCDHVIGKSETEMANREIGTVDSDERTVGLTIGAALGNAFAIAILFIVSRFVRALWSEMAGNASYWLLGVYVWICLAMLRLDLFRRVRNPDTSF